MTPEQRKEIEAWRKRVDDVFVAPSVGWRALCHIDALLSAIDAAEARAEAAEERVRELEESLKEADSLGDFEVVGDQVRVEHNGCWTIHAAPNLAKYLKAQEKPI